LTANMWPPDMNFPIGGAFHIEGTRMSWQGLYNALFQISSPNSAPARFHNMVECGVQTECPRRTTTTSICHPFVH
jgi:hypothetical protein